MHQQYKNDISARRESFPTPISQWQQVTRGREKTSTRSFGWRRPAMSKMEQTKIQYFVVIGATAAAKE